MKIVSSKNSFEYENDSPKKGWLLKLTPLLFIVAILPLVIHSHIYKPNLMDYTWYTGGEETADMFLYFKQWILVTLGMLMMVVLIIRMCITNKKISFKLIFIPLLIYAIMALISSGKSEYASYTYSGLFEQFENVFALLTYCVIVYYAFTFINYETDLKIIIQFLIGSSLILTVIGIFQITSHDLLRIPFFQKLYLSKEILADLESLSFNFEANRVYLTLLNSNYVGVYTAMMIPLLICLTYFSKKVWRTVIYMTALIGMVICLVGSKSKAGIIAVMVSVLFLAFFLRKQLLKKWYLTVSGVVAGIAVVLALVLPGSPVQAVDLSSIFSSSVSEKPALEDIHTDQEYVYITYKGNTLRVAMWCDGLEFQGFLAIDENGNTIQDLVLDSEGQGYYTNDSRFSGFVFTPIQVDENLGFVVTIDGTNWIFTNQIGDSGSYCYINNFFRVDNIETAKSALFTNHTTFASGRGFIWSRTIPLLKDSLLLGVGANAFAFAFPHTDYVGYYNNGFANQMLTKPHSWYLQMGVETGVVSMIAMIIFYLIYFVSSVNIYRKNSFENYSSCLGVSIFIATTSYMTMGISNDSSITVAPVFWVLIGVGIAINYKFHKIIKVEEE